MLKQPKGLIAAALANTGERFGFYTMMAILTLFLMSKFGIDGEQAGKIYSFFYTSIYILALVGGLIADRLRNYKGTIIAGILVMTAGYAALMVPTVTSKTVVIGALMVIAFGNGLFKGNLQALVGQLYDNEQYAKLRDTGFQITCSSTSARCSHRSPPWACATGGSVRRDSSTTPTFRPSATSISAAR